MGVGLHVLHINYLLYVDLLVFIHAIILLEKQEIYLSSFSLPSFFIVEDSSYVYKCFQGVYECFQTDFFTFCGELSAFLLCWHAFQCLMIFQMSLNVQECFAEFLSYFGL